MSMFGCATVLWASSDQHTDDFGATIQLLRNE
jgi:hypothetical protein